MNKQFKELDVDSSFNMNGIEYTKINAVKISCCKSINAQEKNNPNNKTFVQPLVEVEVND
jgi:hypothetical protein